MTTRTDGAVSMSSQLFTNGGRPARVGLNTAYVRWRWRRWPAKQIGKHKLPRGMGEVVVPFAVIL